MVFRFVQRNRKKSSGLHPNRCIFERMCYQYSLKADTLALSQHYGKKTTVPFSPDPLVSGFTFPLMPVVAEGEIRLMHWGLIPSWIRSSEEAKEIRTKTLNARCETLTSRPSFSDSFLHRRCLIPATGFFEWQHRGDHVVPFFISLKGQSVFSFAGIFDSYQPPGAEEAIRSFSLLTTRANSMMEQIHNAKKRMPVILTQDAEALWLNTSSEPDTLLSLFQPYEFSLMQAHTIAKPGTAHDVLKYVPYSAPSLFGEDSDFLDRFQ
jgi:putative SOS response-associated peptidase YedK